jgi:hypothetical protein
MPLFILASCQFLDDWIPLIGSLVSIVTPIAGICIACLGLSAWHRQLDGTSKYQAIRGLRRAAFRLELALRDVRLPIHHRWIDVPKGQFRRRGGEE